MVMVAGADLRDVRRHGFGMAIKPHEYAGCEAPDWRMDDLHGTEWRGDAWRHPDGTLRRSEPVDEPADRATPPKFRVLDGTREDALDRLGDRMRENTDYWAQQAATFEIERTAARAQCAELRDKVAELRGAQVNSSLLGFLIGLIAGAALVWGLL
jgi:hypothetical protein